MLTDRDGLVVQGIRLMTGRSPFNPMVDVAGWLAAS